LGIHFGLHRQEFLKSQGLDVTEDEIREALRITTPPPTTAWTTAAPVGPGLRGWVDLKSYLRGS